MTQKTTVFLRIGDRISFDHVSTVDVHDGIVSIDHEDDNNMISTIFPLDIIARIESTDPIESEDQ